MKSFSITASRVAALAVCGFAATHASAALLAGDSYTVGDNRAAGEWTPNAAIHNSSNASVVTPGFINGGYTSGLNSANNFIAAPGGLGSAQFNGSGGQINWIGLGSTATAVNRGGSRPIGSGTTAAAINPTPTYYTSTILRRGNDTADASNNPLIPAVGALTGVGFTNAVTPVTNATSAMTGFYIGFAGTDGTTDRGSLVIRSRNGTTNTLTDTILIDGKTTSTANQTYQVYTRTRYDYGSAAGASVDEILYWVNPTDISSEAAMTASSLVSGAFDNFSLQSTGSLARLSFVSTVGSSGTGVFYSSAAFDEVRLGTTLADVVPEPTSLAALAGAAVVTLRRRRK